VTNNVVCQFLPPYATMSRQYVVYFFYYYLPFILEKDYKHKRKAKAKAKANYKMVAIGQ